MVIETNLIGECCLITGGARKEADDNLRFDFVWCVFDSDDHPGIPAAKQQARDNGINLAISNPCFEIWILLHFQDHRSHVQRQTLRGMCRKSLPAYVKGVRVAADL